VALTDPDNFKEQEVDQMIADPAFLQKSVNEVVKLLVEDNQ
jgi:hypothetical protein